MSAFECRDGPPPDLSNAIRLEPMAKIADKDADQLKEIPLDDVSSLNRVVESELNTTDKDLQNARLVAENMSLAEVQALMGDVLKIHENDPNFPPHVLERAREFLAYEDLAQHAEEHAQLIYEMKIEAALITGNSPYSEVRAVVDNHDDPAMPASTIRSWVIGIFFSCVLAFVNQLFSIRFPPVELDAQVVQLLAYPIGRFWQRVMPDKGFTLWGTRHSLNPGPFNKKEHMLITIMASVAQGRPYTNNIIWIQYLPAFFNQPYAAQFSYQILLALSTCFIGYGMAGLTRRFLVYPSYCVWPASLVTIAVNTAFHTSENPVVEGPFRRLYSMSRYRFFLISCAASFAWFWFPDFIFQALSKFSWMTWIAPDNVTLTAITGYNGLGINPLPTFDWNLFSEWDPLKIPFFSIFNVFGGAVIAAIAVASMWYTNALWTSYLPIVTNKPFDNTGHRYNVSKVTDEKGLFDSAKYSTYSPVFISAGNLVIYFAFFAQYPAVLTYIILNHGFEMKMGFKNLYNSIRNAGNTRQGQYQDVHNRLMAKYAEVPEWWYTVVLILSFSAGIAGISGWDTQTPPWVVLYGLILCVVFVIPLGIIKAITGVEVTLNVLAEFIGGSFVTGNALAMNFFKSYGYVTCAQALLFANDLKLAHYVKIPPRQTFAAQIGATLISTFVSTALLNFQMGLKDICTDNAPFKMTCPGIITFFTASVLWGVVGPKKVFGPGGQYVLLMAGWAAGAALPVLHWYARKRFPGQTWLRSIHPVIFWSGGLLFSPTNMSYLWPSVPIGWLSWIWLKRRYVGLWGKYNFVLSAALTTGIAIASVVIFFALELHEVKLPWWGNEVRGCEKTPCVLKTVADGEFFGPREWH